MDGGLVAELLLLISFCCFNKCKCFVYLNLKGVLGFLEWVLVCF